MTQNNNIKIAVTGGIGSGKSEVCKIIKNAGYPVFSCDEIYFRLFEEKIFDKDLKNAFGDGIFCGGRVDRKRLSELVFNDKDKLKKLNEITHPKILSCAFSEMNGKNLSFLEVPLLFENGFESLFDGVIVVLRDFDERVKSIVKRSTISTNEAILRIKSQFDYDNNSFAKYYVIHNCSNLQYLQTEVERVLRSITKS